MRKTSENLHELIKSMNKSEKGYFLKHAAKYNNNNQYIKLFKAIDSQEIYDENRIRESLKNEPFIKQLHVAKRYLFNALMKSLYLYSGQNSLNYQFSEAVSSIAHLYNRGLCDESLKLILKCKKDAYDLQKYDCLPELIRWQKYILLNTLTADVPGLLKKLSDEEKRIIEIISDIFRYRELYIRIYSHIRLEGSARNEEQENEYKNIMKDPLLKSIESASCYESKLLYYQVHLVYSQAEADDKSIYQNSGELIELMDKYPVRINDFLKEYVFALIENLSAAFNLGKFKEALNIISYIRSLDIKSREEKEYIFMSTYIIQFMINIVSCKFNEAALLIPEAESQLKKLRRKNIKAAELILYQNIFYVYFALGNYSKALEWINKILSTKLEIRRDIYSLAHIFSLLVHYELNNLELLSYAVVNTYRYLYKRKNLYKFEEVLLRFLRRISGADDIKDEFKFLKSEILKLMEDPYERIPLSYFDFISWLDSKITGKSFIEAKKSNL